MSGQVGEAARLAVVSRSAGFCEVDSRHRASQVHHRRPRGRGGTRRPEINLPGNLLHVCDDCHAGIESHRELARDLGLLLPADVVAPSEEPVWLRHLYGEGWWQLGDDGLIQRWEDWCEQLSLSTVQRTL